MVIIVIDAASGIKCLVLKNKSDFIWLEYFWQCCFQVKNMFRFKWMLLSASLFFMTLYIYFFLDFENSLKFSTSNPQTKYSEKLLRDANAP